MAEEITIQAATGQPLKASLLLGSREIAVGKITVEGKLQIEKGKDYTKDDLKTYQKARTALQAEFNLRLYSRTTVKSEKPQDAPQDEEEPKGSLPYPKPNQTVQTITQKPLKEKISGDFLSHEVYVPKLGDRAHKDHMFTLELRKRGGKMRKFAFEEYPTEEQIHASAKAFS